MDGPDEKCVRVLEAKLLGLEHLLQEKERRIEDKFMLIVKSLDERHRTQKEALAEAKRVVDARLTEMNNLRFQIEGERRSYVTKGEFTVAGMVVVAIGFVAGLLKWLL